MPATLSIGPPSSDLTIMNGSLPSETFTATLTYEDGQTQDVTDQTAFSIDPGFGDFSANTLTAKAAGKIEVQAMWQDKTASAQVIVHLKDVRVDPAVPPNAPGWFSGPEDPSRAPRVVYPAVGVIMPRNLGDFEVHWTDSSGNDVFEVSLVTEFADVRAYVPGGNGSIMRSGWTAFLAEEWRAAVGATTTLQFQVRGVQSANPIAVGSAAPQLVQLSNEDMQGGLYYWASQSTTGVAGIFRHDMSLPGQPAQQFMTTAQTGGRCVACHVLSHDGTHMLVTYDGGNHLATTVDVASQAAAPATNMWNFGSFTPDGSEVLVVYQGSLVVRRYSDQAIAATMPASGWVTHPDLSPDGKKLVYVHPNTSTYTNDYNFKGGSIFVRSYDAATHTFGPELQLVADGQNNYYPTFSPDGEWILFNKAPSGSAYNNVNATLWVIKADNSLAPIQLTTASSTLGNTDSWGRWAPFAQTFGASENMFWVTVSSKRDFGVRLVAANRPQIWMTPFFPDRAAQAQDPSAPPFRLPFQAIESNNHIAQWTEQVITIQ
jgi:TolB protein